MRLSASNSYSSYFIFLFFRNETGNAMLCVDSDTKRYKEILSGKKEHLDWG